MDLEQRNDHVGDRVIHAEMAGAGPPLLLLHGLAGSTRWWAKNIHHLAAHFQVFTIDLIGFGGSRKRHQRFNLTDAASCLARWIDLLGIERASVVGHSMGGYIAAELAADFSERVDHLVLVDAAALPLAQHRLRAILNLLSAVRTTPSSFLPVLFRDASRAGPVTIWNAASQLFAADISNKLPVIECPTLVIWGANDTLIPPSIGDLVSQTIPNATFTLIESAGHNPMWDQPEVFNRILLDFLNHNARR